MYANYFVAGLDGSGGGNGGVNSTRHRSKNLHGSSLSRVCASCGGNRSGQNLKKVIDFGLGGLQTNGDPEARVCLFFCAAHGQEHVRWAVDPGLASRARRNGDFGLIEQKQ